MGQQLIRQTKLLDLTLQQAVMLALKIVQEAINKLKHKVIFLQDQLLQWQTNQDTRTSKLQRAFLDKKDE